MKLSHMTALLALSSATSSCAEHAPSDGPQGRAISALEQGGECLVGDETLEHACLHMKFGPFQTVSTQPYPGTVFNDINTPHTAYTMTLGAQAQGFQGAVLYQPTVTGEFAFLTDGAAAVSVFDGAGSPVTSVGVAPGDGALCAEIGQVAVFALSDTETYTLVMGSEADVDPTVVVEYLGAEASCEEPCEPLTLTAARSYGPPSWVDDERVLEHHIVFELPTTIPVVEGRAGSGLVLFSFANEVEEVDCRYRGRGRRGFVFHDCSNGAQPGDDVEAEYLKLRVARGGNTGRGKTTAVELTIQPECDHHHEEPVTP
jgi:hypothetical protein